MMPFGIHELGQLSIDACSVVLCEFSSALVTLVSRQDWMVACWYLDPAYVPLLGPCTCAVAVPWGQRS